MRAVSYVRFVSGYSFEVQQRAFLDYCAASGLEVGPTFTSRSRTLRSFDVWFACCSRSVAAFSSSCWQA